MKLLKKEQQESYEKQETVIFLKKNLKAGI